MVAGVAAASRGRAGRIEGVAPGAQLLAIKHGMTFSAFAWALITAFADERSDVVLVEASVPPAGATMLADGRSLLGLLVLRLSQRYQKFSCWTADNVPAMSTIVDASIAPETLSVGAYDTAESFRAHYGLQLPWKDALHSIGSEGPAGNGALKPDVVAPSIMTSLRDGYLGSESFGSLPGLYEMPPGYAISGGTSSAAPAACGAVALLMSAARQTGLPHDAPRIKRALLDSARYLSGAGSYQQGAGVIRAAAAWDALQAAAKNPEPVSVDVIAPVRTVSSAFLPTPHRGAGIFEREGWRSGDEAVRSVTLIRRNGPEGPMHFTTQWQGNFNGVFRTAREVVLPLGEPVALDIVIAPKQTGVHSATLLLVSGNRATPTIRVPVTIVVPHELDRANGFVHEQQIEVPTQGRNAVFVRVPEGVEALTVEVSHARRYTQLMIQDPAGQHSGFYLFFNPVTGRSVETIPVPQAGVWGLFLSDRSGRAAWFGADPELAAYRT
ncbi:MAG TPA: S8 family serine peptidase, partial [Steroidobacteraceae bacterium]